MKSLEEIKNEVSELVISWDWSRDSVDVISNSEYIQTIITEVAKRYAIEVAKEALKNASENVKMKLKEDYKDLHMNNDWNEIDKQSILSETNIPEII